MAGRDLTDTEKRALKGRDSDVASFLEKVRQMPAPARAGSARGRLVFALDATMSRQPTWDHAIALQGDMFTEAGKLGGLDVQLVYFRGLSECRASRWTSDAEGLKGFMTQIACRGGHTQIRKVLAHAVREAEKGPVSAVVYIGDAMEEPIDTLCARAGELALRNVRTFMFQEGRDPVAENAFREVARITGGGYERFDLSSAARLRELLKAVAAYAAGGLKALESQGDAGRLLLRQIRPGR
ncbi:MAG: VWA domain-containing protein [Rhodobiaceae bacterium]|nr:VWA domain-containing protein [Rhodobiaceae bacterium]